MNFNFFILLLLDIWIDLLLQNMCHYACSCIRLLMFMYLRASLEYTPRNGSAGHAQTHLYQATPNCFPK